MTRASLWAAFATAEAGETLEIEGRPSEAYLSEWLGGSDGPGDWISPEARALLALGTRMSPLTVRELASALGEEAPVGLDDVARAELRQFMRTAAGQASRLGVADGDGLSDRIVVRTSPDVKRRIARAAGHLGTTTSAFVLNETMRRVIELEGRQREDGDLMESVGLPHGEGKHVRTAFAALLARVGDEVTDIRIDEASTGEAMLQLRGGSRRSERFPYSARALYAAMPSDSRFHVAKSSATAFTGVWRESDRVARVSGLLALGLVEVRMLADLSANVPREAVAVPSHGLTLVAGPMCAGKTTLLNAMASSVAAKHLVALVVSDAEGALPSKGFGASVFTEEYVQGCGGWAAFGKSLMRRAVTHLLIDLDRLDEVGWSMVVDLLYSGLSVVATVYGTTPQQALQRTRAMGGSANIALASASRVVTVTSIQEGQELPAWRYRAFGLMGAKDESAQIEDLGTWDVTSQNSGSVA